MYTKSVKRLRVPLWLSFVVLAADGRDKQSSTSVVARRSTLLVATTLYKRLRLREKDTIVIFVVAKFEKRFPKFRGVFLTELVHCESVRVRGWGWMR